MQTRRLKARRATCGVTPFGAINIRGECNRTRRTERRGNHMDLMGRGTSGESGTPNLEDLLRLGIRTAKSGNKEGARVMFQQVLDIDKRNERAWLWLASVAETDIDRRRYLQTVLRINPNNANAKKHLASMDRAVDSAEQRSMRLGLTALAVIVLLIIFVVIMVIIL